MEKASRFAAGICIILILVLAIGPSNLFFFIDVSSLILVVLPTWLGLLMTFGSQGFAQLFRWIFAATDQQSMIAKIGYCGALLSIGFGGLGSMIGLVLMLQNLDDPSALGLGMAVAALPAIYGVVQAAIIFVPMMFARPAKDQGSGSDKGSSMPANGTVLLLGLALFPWAIMGKIFLLLVLALSPMP